MRTGLERLDALREKKTPEEWSRPPFTPASSITILAFDQSMAKTGWALMSSEHPYVLMAGTLSTTAVETGYEGDFQRVVELHLDMTKIIRGNYHSHGFDNPTLVAHETPPVGNVIGGGRSSIMSACALRVAAAEAWLPTHMVGAQRAKARLTGKRDATKQEVGVAILEMWPHLSIMKPWNEAVRDAIAVGVVAIEEYQGEHHDQSAH